MIAQGDKIFRQSLETAVIFHILLNLEGLVGPNALGELFAMKETLKDVIGAAGSGQTGRARLEELLAQGAAAEAVNGLHLCEKGLPFLNEVIKIWFHGQNVSI